MSPFKPTIEFVYIAKKRHITLFEQLLALLDKSMSTPTWGGWFHLLCVAAVVALCVVVIKKARNLSDRQLNMILGITAGTLMVLEIYKQFNFSYKYTEDSWGYQWYAFPFQFCSTPMYVMLAAAIVKNERVKTSLYAFLATYALFAGSAVMVYPNDVFIETIGINIQTMIHHGTMVVVGVLMYASGRVPLSHKNILRALPTFGVLVGIALTANLLYGAVGDPEQTFNMFFISPYYRCTLPILSAIYGKIPYLAFLSCYVFGFSAAGYIMSLGAMGIQKLHGKVKLKTHAKKRA